MAAASAAGGGAYIGGAPMAIATQLPPSALNGIGSPVVSSGQGETLRHNQQINWINNRIKWLNRNRIRWSSERWTIIDPIADNAKLWTGARICQRPKRTGRSGPGICLQWTRSGLPLTWVFASWKKYCWAGHNWRVWRATTPPPPTAIQSYLI